MCISGFEHHSRHNLEKKRIKKKKWDGFDSVTFCCLVGYQVNKEGLYGIFPAGDRARSISLLQCHSYSEQLEQSNRRHSTDVGVTFVEKLREHVRPRNLPCLSCSQIFS